MSFLKWMKLANKGYKVARTGFLVHDVYANGSAIYEGAKSLKEECLPEAQSLLEPDPFGEFLEWCEDLEGGD